jgi:hypothetical protein
LRTQRLRALNLFCNDVVSHADRYVTAALPSLPFSDRHFDLVLSGHLLFAYGDYLSHDFHLKSLLELVRVSKGQVRLFPIRGRDGSVYPEMDILRRELQAHKILSEIKKIDYEFLRNCNEIMVLNTS